MGGGGRREGRSRGGEGGGKGKMRRWKEDERSRGS